MMKLTLLPFIASFSLIFVEITTPCSEAQTQAITPVAATAFISSFGMNTHFNYTNTPYVLNHQRELTALEAMGVKHIRDGVPNPTPDYAETLDQLCSRGIHHTIGFGLAVTPSQIRSAIDAYGPACIDAVEPQNEIDGSHNPNWPALILNEQRTLFDTVKSEARYSQITVLGPALSNLDKLQAIGDVESISDAGNIHDGTCDGEPTTRSYRNILTSAQHTKVAWPEKSVWVTETSYGDKINGPGCDLPDSVIAKYVLRTQLERWLIGQTHVYWYEFSDQPTDSMFGKMGFVTDTGVPKPQYNAVAGLIKILADSSSSASDVTPLSLSISSTSALVHHLLLQKKDGTYALLAWVESPSWDTKIKQQLAVAPERISIALPFAPVDPRLFTMDGNGTFSSQALTSSQTLTAAVRDSVQVFEFRR